MTEIQRRFFSLSFSPALVEIMLVDTYFIDQPDFISRFSKESFFGEGGILQLNFFQVHPNFFHLDGIYFALQKLCLFYNSLVFMVRLLVDEILNHKHFVMYT